MAGWKERRGGERQRRATQIQSVFRGWRTRQRVVWRVRDDFQALVADIEGELESSWALLGPDGGPLPFALAWGDGKLRLPRMQDAVFSLKVDFPLVPQEGDEVDVAAVRADETATAVQNAAEAGHSEPSCSNTDELNEAVALDTSSPVLPNGEAMENCLSAGSSVAKSGSSSGPVSGFGSRSSSNLSMNDNSDQSNVAACTSHGSSATDVAAQANGETVSESKSSTAAGDVMKPSGAETRAVPQATTSERLSTAAAHQAEELDMDETASPLPALQPTRGKHGHQLADVQEILATYSRDEMLLELQWARQALRDRRKYLRSKRHVAKEPARLACA